MSKGVVAISGPDLPADIRKELAALGVTIIDVSSSRLHDIAGWTATWRTGWRVRDADTYEAELGSRAFWFLVKENG